MPNYSAHEISQNKQHKSISASDVLKALEVVEFGDLVPRLQIELNGKHRLLFSDGMVSLVSYTPRLIRFYLLQPIVKT